MESLVTHDAVLSFVRSAKTESDIAGVGLMGEGVVAVTRSKFRRAAGVVAHRALGACAQAQPGGQRHDGNTLYPHRHTTGIVDENVNDGPAGHVRAITAQWHRWRGRLRVGSPRAEGCAEG